MNLNELKGQIKNGNIMPFYIFTGEEIELQNIYLNKMGNVVRVDSVSNVYRQLTSKLLIGNNKDNIYVCRDDDDFIKNEKAWTNISNKIKNGTLVLQLTSPNKRSKFYKTFENTNIVEFNHVSTAQLQPMISKLIDGDVKYLIECCDNDYKSILNFIDIFKRLGYERINKQIIDEIVPHKTETTVFELADALMMLDSKRVYSLLDTLLEDKSNAMGIIYAVANQLHKCVLVEGYRGSSSISKDTGINGWVCNNILKYNNIKPAKLLSSLRIVQKYDKGVKTGVYDSTMACYYMVTEILSL